jgi:hypothetical protein
MRAIPIVTWKHRLLYLSPLVMSTTANLSARWAFWLAGAQWDSAYGLGWAVAGGVIGFCVAFGMAIWDVSVAVNS